MTILMATMAISASVGAAQKSGSDRAEAFYRCRDANGQVHYGDSMPPACHDMDTEVLNQHGMLVREIEGARTRQARAGRESAEKSARAQREAEAQRDRMLIDTYLTVADIERLRDQRLELLQSQFKVTQQSIANLQERQTRIQTQIARFKPYSKDPNAPPLPEHIAEEMVNTVNGLQVYRTTLADNKRDQTALRAAFERDIRRFKELKGIR
ncbi:MAG: DUF4124 domain-containing protein [Steroidobacteraceae bacterium]